MKRYQHEIVAFSLTLGFPCLLWHALNWIVLWIWGAEQQHEWRMALAGIAWAPGFIFAFTVLMQLQEDQRRLQRLEEEDFYRRRAAERAHDGEQLAASGTPAPWHQ